MWGGIACGAENDRDGVYKCGIKLLCLVSQLFEMNVNLCFPAVRLPKCFRSGVRT